MSDGTRIKGVFIGLGLLLPGIAAAGPIPDNTRLDCRAGSGGNMVSWQIHLGGSATTATVDGKEVAAEYSPSHVRIALAAQGLALFIGRGSGRLVVSGPDGRTVARGVCDPRTEA